MTIDNSRSALANIFIIDDEPIAAKVIEMYLITGGFNNLHVFNNSVEAIDILSIVQADLIITDVNMPELGGKFLTKLVRNYPHLSATPVVVITSDETEKTRTNLMANGAFRILQKPVAQETLLKVVEKAIKLRHHLLGESEPVLTKPHQSIPQEREMSLRTVFNRV